MQSVLVALVVLSAFSLFYFTERGRHRTAEPAPSTPPELAVDSPRPTSGFELQERWMYEQEHLIYGDNSEAFAQHVNCRICGPGPLRNGEVPSEYTHDWYTSETITKHDCGYGSTWQERRREKTTSPSQADVVSSEIAGHEGWHTPMIDIDLPARLVPSTTPGHYHLYIDKPMPWNKYLALLRAMRDAGLVEPGFVDESKKRKKTMLRPPWKEKQPIT